MINDTKILSMIIPIHKPSTKLLALLQQIQALKYARILEVICVGNAQCNSLFEQVSKCEYQNVYCMQAEFANSYEACNIALEQAKGSYVWFFNANNTIDVVVVDQILQDIHDKGNELSVLSCTMKYKNKKHKVKEVVQCFENNCYHGVDIFPYFNYFLSQHLFDSVTNKIYKLDVCKKYHLQFRTEHIVFNEVFFNIDYFYHINDLQFYEDVIGECYIRNESYELEYGEQYFTIFLEVIEEMEQLLKIKGIYEETKDALDAFIVDNLIIVLRNGYCKKASLNDLARVTYIEEVLDHVRIQAAIQNSKVKQKHILQGIVLLHKKGKDHVIDSFFTGISKIAKGVHHE